MYTRAFNKAFEETIGHEGGYVNDPDDPGGETNFGISKKSYPNVNIKELTVPLAKEIYYKDFWQKQSCNLFEDYDDISIELFDTSVNAGVYRGAKIFQESLNLSNRNQRDYLDIIIDGSIGPKTISAFRKSKNKKLIYKLMNLLQGELYINLMRSNAINEKYVGWFNRVKI